MLKCWRYFGVDVSPYSGRAPYGWRWECLLATGFAYAQSKAGMRRLIRSAKSGDRR